jgi:predicted RNase H-like nuclease
VRVVPGQPTDRVNGPFTFAALLGTPARASKKTWAGMIERRKALEAAGITLDGIEGVATVRAAVDDVLDAAVAAWTGQRIASGKARSFPDSPLLDASGRPVAIFA